MKVRIITDENGQFRVEKSIPMSTKWELVRKQAIFPSVQTANVYLDTLIKLAKAKAQLQKFAGTVFREEILEEPLED